MILDLPDTTVSAVSKALVTVRQEGGAVALGRVLTLIILMRHSLEEEVVAAANDASREHPMRVIVLMSDPHGPAADAAPRLDAQIRVGGDAGASEVVVLRAFGAAGNNSESLVTGLLLPDAPVVAWWPKETPEQPARSSVGRIAQRRITDAAAQEDPGAWISALGRHYTPGDTDLAWTRLTHWREQLAAVLDQPPYDPITAVEVRGAGDSPSTPLLAAWLGLMLDVPVTSRYLDPMEWASGIRSVRLSRDSGDILMERPRPDVVVLTQPDQPSHELAFPRRTLRECLAEELRSLDPDVLYGRVITDGCALLPAQDGGDHA